MTKKITVIVFFILIKINSFFFVYFIYFYTGISKMMLITKRLLFFSQGRHVHCFCVECNI